MKYADRLYANADRRKAEQEWLNKFAEQQPSKSTVGDIKESDELYTPWVGGLINGVKGLERTAYDALGGLNAQLAGWGANQYTGAGDAQRYKEFVEDNPEFAAKNMATPEQYEKTRLENPTFWQQVMGGVDEKTNYTQDEAKKLEQSWMLDAEKPWIDRGNNVENVRYSRRPGGWGEQLVTDVAANVPQLAEAALTGAASGAVGGAPGAAVGAALSMAKNIYGQSYGDLRRKGRSMDAAHGAAAIDTLYQMPFEYTSASRIFKTIPGLRRAVGKLSPEGKSKFAEWLKTVASEGSTEFAQTYGDSSADDIADAIERGDFQKDFETGAKSAGNIIYKNTLGDKAEENFKESAYAGLLGGVMGGGAHGAGIAMDAVARKLAGNPNPTQEDVVQAIVKARNDIAQDSDNDGDNPTGGDNSFGNDVLNFLHNQTDVQMTEGQMRNLAAAMAGNAFQESGYDSTAENSIGAYGSFQHLGERRAALKAFAEENGLDPSSRQAQIAFAWEEMMTEGTLENQAFQSIMGLEDNQAKEAAVIYRKLFERPGEEEANDEARVKEAQRVHDSFTQAQQFLKDTAERMDIATEEDAALANELNRLAEEGREEEVLAKARELGFKEQREKELNQQREQIAKQTEEEQNNIPKAPQAAPTPQGQAGQLAPIQTENTQAPQAQQQPVQGMETVNKDRTAPHIDRDKANKGNFNNRGNYNGRLDAPQNKRVESPIRNQGQSAPILQQGENQNAENLQTQTTQRGENRENLDENPQPQQTQTAENQAITQNPQGNEVTPTLAPSNQGTAGIAQNTPKIDSNGQNEITNKVNSEALAKAAENDLATVSGETKDTSQTGEEVNNAPLEAILEEVNAFPWANDSTISAFKKAVDAKVRAVREGAMSAKTAKSVIRGAYTRAYKRLDERFLKKEIDRQEFNALNQTMSDMMNQASRMMKPENVAIYRGRKGNNNIFSEANKENTENSKNILDNEANAADNKENGVVAKENENDSRRRTDDAGEPESVQGTSGRVQERQRSAKNNRSDSQGQRAGHGGVTEAVSGFLTEEQVKQFNSIDPSIRAEEWKDSANDLEGFCDRLNDAKETNEHGAFVDSKTPDKLVGAKVAITSDGMAGVAVKADGDIVAVFKHPNKKAPRAIRSIMTLARAKGGTKGDCFGKGLVKMYEEVGLIPVAKIPFYDGDIAKDENGRAIDPKDQILLDQRPDVYVLMTNGDDFATATKKIANNEYPISTQEELDALPVFANEETGYTDAQEYRDALLAGDTKKAEKIRSEKAEKTAKEETKALQEKPKDEKPKKTKAQQKADAEKDAKAKKLLTKDAYDKVYAPLVNVLEQAQPEVAKAARDTALLMAKTADILHKRFKMKWENAPRVLLGGNAEIGTGIYGHNVIIEDLDVDALPAELNVTEIKGDEFGEWEDINELRKKALQYYMDKLQGRKVRNPILGEIIIDSNADIEFTGSGKKKAKSTGARVEKWLTLKHLRGIIENANSITEAGTNKEKHEGEHFYYLHHAVQSAGEKQYVIVTVRRFIDSKKSTLRYYNHNIYTEAEYKELLEKASPDNGAHVSNTGRYQSEAFSDNSVTEKKKVYKSGEKEFNQIAWHGSPYTFDAFTLSKIGSGEGAQAHGWGLYFAQDEIVSRGYKSALQRDSRLVMVIDGKKYNQPDPIEREYVDENGDKVKRNSAVSWVCYALQYGIRFSESGDVVPEAKYVLEKNLELFKHGLKRGGAFKRTVEQTEEIIKTIEKALSIIKNGKANVILESDSRLYKVDIPENDVLLDEQKGYKDQPDIVKKGIVSTLLAMELSNEQKEDFYNKVRNSINASEETNGAWKRFKFTKKVISNLNILLKANEVGVVKVEEAKTFLEQIYTKEEINAIAENHAKWKNEKAKWTEKNIETFAEYEQSRANDEAELERECRLIDPVKTDNLLKRLNWTGKDVYKTLKALLGNSKDASLELNKHGIKGITYIGGRDGRCFVIFDDKAVKILETYEQQIKDQIAGSYNAVENLIKVFEKGNASTAVHESAHWYLVTLENLLHAEAKKRGITGTTDEILEQLAEDETMPKDLVSELQKIRNWAQYSEETMKEYEGTELEKEFTRLAEAIKNGDEDAKERFIQERFARGYERYLASGKAPTKELQGIFARFRRWLLDIYNNTIKNLGNKPAPKEIQEIFDRMLEMEETETNTGDTSGEAVKEKSKAKKNYPSGKTVNARTDKADEFPVTYKLIHIEDAITSTNEDFSINENFPQELQPRDRDRSGMKKQVESYASNLSPEEMTIAVKVSEGAPVINQDNIVENGNGRILALLRAYKGGSDAYDESAKRYKTYLREHAADFGFTAEQVDAIERPLLVRQRGSESDNLQRNIVESTSGGMKMSAGQQAKVDAKKISLHTLSLYNYDGSGDLDLASNGRFVKAVLDETISQYDQDSMFTADGSISRDAKARVNNALCALAYGDTDLLDRVSESSDNDYKNYVSAYTIAAPRVAYAKKLMENGDVSEDFDVAKMLNETLAFVLQCKKENVKVSEKLRAGAGLFTPGSSQFAMDGSREFAKFLGNNIRKQRRMADTIKEIADGVIKKAENGQTTGFFGEDDTTFYDVVRNALGMGNSQFNSDDEACTLSTKDEAFDALTENQKKGLTAVAKDYGGTYDESTHTYTFPDEISLEEAREEMDALLDPTKHDFKASAQGKLVEKMRKNAKILSEDELTDREKGIVAFAEKMGVKLRFFEGDSRLHGFQSDDVIYLNRNSAMNLNQVFWHETFHWLKRNNPKLYEALEKAVLQNDDIAAQVKAWQEKTGRTNLTEEEAIEEMLADAMFDASTRGKFFETLGITHPTLVQKLIKWIKNTYRDLVNQFRHTEGFKPEAGLTNTQINRMSIALDNMALKLVDGNGNKLFSKDAKGNLKENTVKDVRYIDGVKYKVTNKTLKDTDRVPIIDLTNAQTVDLTDKAQTDQLINSFANQPFNFIGGQGVIKKNDKNNAPDKNKQVWKQILHGHGRGKRAQKKATDPTRSKVIANLPAVLEKSVYVDKHPDSAHGTSTEYIESFAVVKNGNEYSVFCISERERGIAKSDEVGSALPYNIKKVKSLNVPQIGGSQNSLTSGIIITDVLDGVNDRNKNPYVKNGVLKHSVEIPPQDTQQDTQQDTEKYSVDLSDLENGKVFNNEEQNKKAQSVQKSMELAKDSDTKHFMSKFAGKLFGQKEYDTRKNVAIEGQKDYKQRAKDVSLYGVLTQIISPSRLKDERLKTIYIEGEKAKRTQAKLYSKWTEKHKKILDLVEKAEDYAGYVRALLSEDSESRVFTDDELREMGCSDKVIEAHKQVRALLKEIRDKIAEVYLAKHFEVKNFKTQVEAEAWAANPFFEKVEVKPMKKVGGTVWQVKYDTVPYTKMEETVTKWELDKLKEREGRREIHILESGKVDDTMCTVSYLTPQRTLADLDQYIPHFFHEFLIIERGKGYTKVVGSATTMDEAVEIGNKLAGQKGNEKKQYTITPKGLSFEDGSNSLGIVNKELDELMDGIKDDLSIDLSEAIEAKKQKGKHIFLSALQHRKGAKGWETNLRWVIQHHIGTAARYCALDPYKVKVINYFEKAWGSFADNFTGKDLKAEFAQGLINSVLGVPTRAEKVSDAILELCPLFRNVPQASRVLSSTMLGVMSVLKLGVSPAAAFVNLTQLVNIQGYIGAKWTYEGINRAWKKSKEDMALLDELGTREEAGLETVDVSEATALIAGKYDKQLRQLKKLSDLSMKAFTKAESLLRQAAVLGAYHKALAEGKIEAAARSYALEVNRKANFNYGIEDAPRLFRMLKGSVVGDLFLQFKKYGFKELEVIYDMAFDKSIPKSQKLSFFGAYFLLGGIFNALPFQDTMIELLGLAIDSDDPEAELKEWIMKWAKGSEAKKIVALTAMYGAGSWIGADVSQRVGFRGLTPELEEPLGVTGSTIKQVCTAMLNGDSVGFAKGLSPALGNVVGATKGYNTDSKGRVAYVYKDPLERALRLCGFRTIGEALSVDTQRIVTEARKEKEKERKEAKEAYLENPSYANKQKLKQLGYTDGEIKKLKGNNDSLERTERLKARMTKQELKDFKDVLDW